MNKQIRSAGIAAIISELVIIAIVSTVARLVNDAYTSNVLHCVADVLECLAAFTLFVFAAIGCVQLCIRRHSKARPFQDLEAKEQRRLVYDIRLMVLLMVFGALFLVFYIPVVISNIEFAIFQKGLLNELYEKGRQVNMRVIQNLYALFG
jgi:hypothetical protein